MEINKRYQYSKPGIYVGTDGRPCKWSFLPFEVIKIFAERVAAKFDDGDYEIFTFSDYDDFLEVKK